MAEHTLKCLAPYWDAVERGDKNFEVRRDDRGFQKGDVLILRKVHADDRAYVIKHMAGRDPITQKWRDNEFYELRRRVTYILTGGQFGIEPGYVVLALGPDADA